MNLQDEYIQLVKTAAINPIYCSNNFLNTKINKYTPGKRYSLNFYTLKDYLTVASNQVIFELDAKSYTANYELATKILYSLDNRKIPYYIFSSGGKGIHIECWLDKPQLVTSEFKELFVSAASYGFSFKHIRFWFWNKILDEAGISNELRGNGKIVDSSCINFNDLKDKTKLIRIAGGRKILLNKISNTTEVTYKTYIPKDEFKKKIIKLKDFNLVRYPTSINLYQISIYELSEYLQEYISSSKQANIYKYTEIDLEKYGGYMNLESIKRIREGLNKGQRSLGAQILSIAMANDNLEHNSKMKIMEEYVNSCSQIGDKFSIDEAALWIKWTDSQTKIFWNCGLAESAGLHNKTMCEFCKKNHKESLRLLTQSTLLKQIKEILDEYIVGEDDTKMLIFLLILSKDFPSKRGRPEWNIENDPMSQNIILSSDSSSGKTYIIKQLLKLFGKRDEDYFIISRMSKSAINYLTEINFDGKIIFIEELQGLDENTSQLRVWMSEGEITLNTVEKTINEEGQEVNMLSKKSTIGQPCFISCQAEGLVGDQLNNRSWVLSLDVSDDQTRQILEYQDSLERPISKDIETKLRLISDALKQLEQHHFIIPFSDYKRLNIPLNDVRVRRDYQKFKTLIRSNAYLHQKQRPILKDKDGRTYIICNLDDYNVAKQYSSGILGATFSGLTIEQIDLINHIKKSPWNMEFQISDIMRNLGKSQPYWWGQLKQLEDLGYIMADKSPGRSTLYALNENKIVNVIKLPKSEDLKEFYNEKYTELLKTMKPITAQFEGVDDGS
jgi:hypothetical protein|tara:strand:- start:7276 stop:9627 length:2352 start_codon:yes stop_codon:yes gene_type:complete